MKGATVVRLRDIPGWYVSIHAPVKGATAPAPSSRPAASSFNPRAREGRDSRPRERGTRTSGFNPRAREGRDLPIGNFILMIWFQSTRP